ncbi:FAD/NAD(P)-binding domain-containing protein [Aspergillus steynii IBT 23096]|uniref:FAD/NAD(P)-binding domain-containing protein n=1 Tax=Aspergillus steynii IBT 23096 TaxID=1392250 RepID=A0A2I2FV77_9EURO|nr:FAD/NAD(P)-binding domain-containing protein [Aspergillus steynii IBT 23096]PLB44476.1 FAD/NAD(P)-binding domain-containing protein [Aspergillus steynii IBT 23096]
MASPVDVLIIGGGPAGLTAALTLVRQNHSAILFDSGSYRNGRAKYMHMIPTWDHRGPAEFRAKARSEILNHPENVSIEGVYLTSARKINDSLFEVADAAGKTWQGRKIILATGSEDILPDIPGYKDAWVKRIYHCLYCEGYEDRGATSSGVLAIQTASIAPMAIHLAENAAHLSASVTIYTHGSEELSTQIQTSLGSQNNTHKIFKVDSRPISRLTVVETAGTHCPFTKTKGPFAEQLGVETTPSPLPGAEMGDVVACFPAYQTSVRGVFAAGDCVTQYKVVAGAISSGCNAAVAASTQLLAEKYGHPSLV